jgi:hypothetical protein
MPRHRLVSRRLVAVFLVGCVLFNYPMLAAFERFSGVAGLPSNFTWLMLGWALVIVLMAIVVEKPGSRE